MHRLLWKIPLAVLTLNVFCMLGTWLITRLNGGEIQIAMATVGLTILLALIFLGIYYVFKREGSIVIKAIRDLLKLSILCIALTGCIPGCERVGVGNVGIVVDMAGSNRGVEKTPVRTGWVFYSPFSQSVVEYPVYVQTAVWTKDAHEGGENNDEISFNSRENLTVNGDISLSYKLDPQRVPWFYAEFKSDDLDRFTHGYLKNVARDQFNEVAGTYSVEDILGPKKEEFMHSVRDRINKELNPIGVQIQQLGFIGAPRPPETIIKAINLKISATQNAMQVENEVRAVRAQAEKNVAEAEGQAKSAIARAKGQAEARIAAAEGEATANQKLANSITPVLLEWRRLELTGQAINKWDGRRPTVEGNSTGLLMQLPK